MQLGEFLARLGKGPEIPRHRDTEEIPRQGDRKRLPEVDLSNKEIRNPPRDFATSGRFRNVLRVAA